ncbi:MAG: sigma 54-interacting transcriptional regulator [Acidobacteriota bacterium]
MTTGRSGLLPVASSIRAASLERWGPESAVCIVGRSEALQSMLERVEKLSGFREPVLIHGESGVGKEMVAQALYLLGASAAEPFVTVNCPQYRDAGTTVSELFGHAKGSFTGADADHAGVFERAEGGVIFLDEIADLPMAAQTMLLRTLATGEVQPLGARGARKVDVRTLAATNRSLNRLADAEGSFRRDLLFRLQYFRLDIPPLRARGDDWLLLIDHVLNRLAQRYGEPKRFAPAALDRLAGYAWPGNVRELIGMTTASFALADGDEIGVGDLPHGVSSETGGSALFGEALFDDAAVGDASLAGQVESRALRLRRGEGDFWSEVQAPYLDRELNRSQVRALVTRGLRRAGSYRRLLEDWHGAPEDYQKFMDFLRHHRLKPS